MSACLLPLPLAHGPVQGSGMPSKCTFIWADEHAHGKFRLWHFPLLEEGQNFYVELRGVLCGHAREVYALEVVAAQRGQCTELTNISWMEGGRAASVPTLVEPEETKNAVL